MSDSEIDDLSKIINVLVGDPTVVTATPELLHAMLEGDITAASLKLAALLSRSTVFKGLLKDARSDTDNLAEELANGGKAVNDIWKMEPTRRGAAIEEALATTEYKDWYRVGAERNGYFPLVDFQLGDNLVSVKTVDTTGTSWLPRMEAHIEELANSGATVNGKPANLILDIRVQPGGNLNMQSLRDLGDEYKVIVRISEYGE
jgi:hypothetical protein